MGLQNIQKTVVKVAQDEGITKRMYFDFEVFDIQDMYTIDGNTLCWTCKQGHECDKHKYR